MKLKLRAENDIQILSIAELDSQQNVDVLRAGITQIFKNGKNRIILELSEPKLISADVLRELGRLKLLANELSGDIVLSGLDPDTKNKIDNFSKPPFAISFLTTAQAVNYLKELHAKASKPAVSLPAAPGASTAAPAAASTAQPVADAAGATTAPLAPSAAATAPAHAATAAPNAAAAIATQLKEEIRQRELGEVGQLRKEIERLKTENQSLMEFLHKKVLERREPPNVAAYQMRIQDLEKQLTDILSQPPEKKK